MPSELAIDWDREFETARSAVTEVLDGLGQEDICRQIDPEFSPLGWHYGHIAYTESLWLLDGPAETATARPDLETTFRVDGLPKSRRGELPDRSVIDSYAAEIRDRVRTEIAKGAPARNPRLWSFVLQHESQHCETMTLLRWLAGDRAVVDGLPAPQPERVRVPAGSVTLGSDSTDALDNERGSLTLDVPAFSIDRYPVTRGEFARFAAEDGYRRPEFWSEAGWNWRMANGIESPLYGLEHDSLPVMGVSRHEAEAYCRYRGGRLPTEAEWERAARWDPAAGRLRRNPWGDDPASAEHACHDRRTGGPAPVGRHPAGRSPVGCEDLMGSVWEWTSSTFAPFPGFAAYPYAGYSEAYFDGRHAVIKGGSWATRDPVLRASFRSWYMPETRQILVGFRCVEGADQDKGRIRAWPLSKSGSS